MAESESKARRADLSALRIERSGEVEAPAPHRRGPLVVASVVAAVVLLGVIAVLALRRTSLFAREVSVADVVTERPPSAGQPILVASGYVVARRHASVSPKIAGRIAFLGVEEGTRVAAGDVLARLESSDLEAQVEAARSALREAESRAIATQARRDAADLDRENMGRLFDAGVGSRTARDLADASARAARADVAVAQAAISSARSQLAVAEVALGDATIRAPFDGVVLRKDAEAGESVAPAIASGQTTRGAIATIADLSTLEVEVDVAESNVGRLRDDMPAEVAVDAVPERRYRGRLRQVVPTADRQKATVPVKVALLDADLRLKPEMSAKVTFLSAEPDEASLTAPPVLTIPAAALVTSREVSFAWVVSDGHVAERPVVTGERFADRVAVRSGLAAGEKVVLNPPPDLRRGAAVKTRTP